MEILDLYDSKKRKTEKTLIRENGEPGDGEYKLSAHLWIMNDDQKFLIQKRSASRKVNPNKWAFTGGAVDAGEKPEEGAIREAKEELALDLKMDELELLITFKREHDFVDVWLARSNEPIENIKMQEEEVSESKWVSLSELNEIIKNGEFVPAINLYYDLFIKLLVKCYNLKI